MPSPYHAKTEFHQSLASEEALTKASANLGIESFKNLAEHRSGMHTHVIFIRSFIYTPLYLDNG